MICINSITICPESVTITKGKWYCGAYAQVCPTNATCQCVTWHSSNPNVANVNQNGYIFGVSEGAAVIYATAQDGSGAVGFCNVTVVSPVKVSSVTVTPSTKTVNVGDSFGLSATVCPDNADDKRIRWTSCDCNIADVDYLTGCVTAKSAGTTCICANAIDGSGVQGGCEVKVNVPDRGTDSIGVFRMLSMHSAAPDDTETEAPVMRGIQFSDPQNENYKIRFVSQIKTLNYKRVGYEVHYKIGDAAPVADIICLDKVYESLLADGEPVDPDGGFEYFVLGVKDNIPQNTVVSFKIKPFAITLEGEFLYGNSTLFSFENAQLIEDVDFGIPEGLNVSDHIRVNTGDGSNLNVRSLPGENGTVLGEFTNEKEIALVIDTPQNEKWYAVYGRTTDGTYKFGWCSGEYLEKEVQFKEWSGSGNINVRLGASTDNSVIGKLPSGAKVRLLQENYTTNSHTWHKISYANRDAYIADQPKLSTKNYWIPLVRKKVRGTVTNQDINRIVANVQNCSKISRSKRDAAASFAEILLENDYEPTFVAGILANFEKEGNIGQLENSNYTTNPDKKPDYLKYMDSQYNGLNYYLNNYSNKTIMSLSVNAVYNILLNLKNSSNNTWKINGSRVGFGIGAFQWTFDRSWKLMIEYRKQNNNADTISNSQVINAEMSMLIDELKSNEYYDVLPFWEDQCTSYFDTVDAANRAGFTVCTHYLKPQDTNQPQIRATLAEQIYADMME